MEPAISGICLKPGTRSIGGHDFWPDICTPNADRSIRALCYGLKLFDVRRDQQRPRAHELAELFLAPERKRRERDRTNNRRCSTAEVGVLSLGKLCLWCVLAENSH